MSALTFLIRYALIFMLFAVSAAAQKDRFVGNFVAEDPNTRGITRLVLLADDQINIWGRCHPTDCDWGTEYTFTYGPAVEADPKASADTLMAVYEPGFATKVVIITPLSDDRLRVEVFTSFNDRSRRSPYKLSQIMVREEMFQR